MSPRTPAQFQEIRDEKKSHIMDVAIEHFANEGFHKTTISHIAKHAGISKGLMYNYFASKEELLSEILDKSIGEISHYLDPDKDGFLSEEEFELFVRKFFIILKEKLSFWRLFFQLMMQKAVRDQILKSYLGSLNNIETVEIVKNNAVLAHSSKMINDYFIRKKEKMPADYDPVLDMKMFIYTMEGFARITSFLDEANDIYFNKAVDKIIEVYK
jgi:AcrR family transcriptional regulator